ncbi:LysR family transcriptional regulator [Ruegeria sp. 2205SS24-7]|uniref:LysR family transcriptional regulator n=1 Tax=Ruegeria discodermiae TaxID=3064389 RepID=UPI0027426D24|nr:LysR family transcriptional regulator [Ruegeria sp. 2205SS24-7]MDP5220093.1 LysR family transcriptional regulator [Ruegeria sp. 2205SS24-7]
MKLDPRHLEILAAIVEAGGLTEGAALIGKSQPSVSRSVSLLEDRVGEPLFLPTRRPLQPTELGLVLAQEGQRILSAGRHASRVVDEHRQGIAGAVRVAGTPIFMDGVISNVIAEFQAEYPNIRIDQSYGYHTELLSQLSAETLDLAILPMRPADVSDEYEFRQILPGRNVIACRLGHPLARKKVVKLEDITEFSWIAPPASSPLFRDLRNTLDGIGMRDLKISFTGGSLSAVVNVLTGSDSLTVLPFSVVFMMQRQKTLTALPIKIGDPDRHLGCVTLSARSLPASSNRVLEFIKQKFEMLDRLICNAG